MTYELLNPEKYTGYNDHPINCEHLHRVKRASISPCRYLSGWFDLRIEFEEGKEFFATSDTIRGLKQRFAFQCKAGSKWKQVSDNGLSREEEMKKIESEIQLLIGRLKELEYSVSDRFSTITIFDDRDTGEYPEGKPVGSFH